jgi:hypothetical protein
VVVVDFWQVWRFGLRNNILMDALNQKIEDIFCAAAEVAAEDRQAYLERACAGDAGLRAGVDRMLSKLSEV